MRLGVSYSACPQAGAQMVGISGAAAAEVVMHANVGKNARSAQPISISTHLLIANKNTPVLEQPGYGKSVSAFYEVLYFTRSVSTRMSST